MITWVKMILCDMRRGIGGICEFSNLANQPALVFLNTPLSILAQRNDQLRYHNATL